MACTQQERSLIAVQCKAFFPYLNNSDSTASIVSEVCKSNCAFEGRWPGMVMYSSLKLNMGQQRHLYISEIEKEHKLYSGNITIHVNLIHKEDTYTD